MRYLVQDIFGDEVAELMGDYWGLDREGELKGAFKPCGRKFSLHFLNFGIARARKAKGIAEETIFTFAKDMNRSGDVVSWGNNRTGEVLL